MLNPRARYDAPTASQRAAMAGRRNITLACRCELAEKLAEALKPKAKENQKVRKGGQRGADKSANIGEVVDTREQAAKEAGGEKAGRGRPSKQGLFNIEQP